MYGVSLILKSNVGTLEFEGKILDPSIKVISTVSDHNGYRRVIKMIRRSALDEYQCFIPRFSTQKI